MKDALLQSVLDNPSDDGVRLAYADALEEAGELERAEFIRVQLDLHALLEDIPAHHWYSLDMILDPQDAEDQAWKHRVWGLQRKQDSLFNAAWLPNFDGQLREWYFGHRPSSATVGRPFSMVVARGFVSEATLAADDWLTHADAITSQHPVEQVRLTTIVPPEFRRQVDSEDTGGPGCIIRLPARTWRPFPDGDSPEGRLRNLLAAEWPKITFHFPS